MNRIALPITAVAMTAVFSSFAVGPKGAPEYEGSLREVLGMPVESVSAESLRARRQGWLVKAEAAKPKLVKREVAATRVVKTVADPAAFQGWRVEKSAEPASVFGRNMAKGEEFILDFGEHLVGHLNISLAEYDGEIMDSPCRLRFTFAEVPSDLAIPPDPYKYGLARSWFQDEVVNFDFAPMRYTLPRRYAFRYVKVEVVSSKKRFGFADVTVTAETSADPAGLAPYAAPDPLAAKIDEVARRTLRDCMQTMFEDGPRRDRRLWLGDLRLEALADYVTYRSFDVVKRSIYLLAGTCHDNGLVSTDCYEKPFPRGGNSFILDYIALFPQVVYEYLEATGDRETAEDLWPLCLKQIDFALGTVGADGLVRMDRGWWYFIDHNRSLRRQAAEQGVVVYALKGIARLAKALGREDEVKFVEPAVKKMTEAAKTRLYDHGRGVFTEADGSGVSLLGQAWPVIAGIVAGDEAKRALESAIADKEAVRPRTPYAFHYFIEALYAAGLSGTADKWLRDYWGGMVKKGADTFWEAYVPEDDMASPYLNILANSYCHAWSCAPVCFLRRKEIK